MFNTECIWYIVAPIGQGIHLHFSDFDLKENVYCIQDSLIIYDGENFNIPYGPYCGKSIPGDIQTEYNIVKLVFDRHPVNSTRGFALDFSAVGKYTNEKPSYIMFLILYNSE